MSAVRNVLVHVHHFSPMSEARRAEIASIPGIEVEFFATQDELEARIAEPEIVAVRTLSPQALGRARNLRWMQSWAAGTDAHLYPEMLESDVVLTSVKGNGGIPLAEHAVMLMLMLNRNALEWIDTQRAHRWNNFRHGELNGLTCGIIGLGHSGVDLAQKAHAFHMEVLGIRRTNQPTRWVDRLYSTGELAELLARSDFVVVTAPLTPETEGMIGEAELRAMKPTACIVAYSRGGIIDEVALVRALEEGWIAGAGLDVFADEPLPADSRFWDLPNTIVTPHAGAVTAAAGERGIDIFIDNLRRYTAGEPLWNVVDKRAGY